MKFNHGTFRGKKYIKRVDFSKAVLWKDKQISLNRLITNQFKIRGTEWVIFEDERKNERWSASVSELREVRVLKKEGQEEQFYFPISVFKVSKIRKEVEIEPPSVSKVPEGEVVSSEINQLTLL